MIRTVYVYASLLLILAAPAALAQQDPQFSMYMYNPLYYNPAAAGSEGLTRLQLTYRTQYAGYQTGNGDPGGAQGTQMISFNMPLARIKSGIGVYALNDKYGPSINQAVQLAYAYRMALKNGTLALGVQAGMFNRGLDFGLLRPVDPNDPLIPTGRINQFKPDIGAGVYYNTTDYWVGVSMAHLNGANYSYVDGRSSDPSEPKAYLSAGYRLGFGYNIDLQPSVLVQYSTKQGIRGSVATVNLIGTYDNRIWLGVGYRVKDAVTATAGINLGRNNALRVGGAVDITAGGTQIKSPVSFEFILGYALPAPDPRKKPIIRTPRFRY